MRSKKRQSYQKKLQATAAYGSRMPAAVGFESVRVTRHRRGCVGNQVASNQLVGKSIPWYFPYLSIVVRHLEGFIAPPWPNIKYLNIEAEGKITNPVEQATSNSPISPRLPPRFGHGHFAGSHSPTWLKLSLSNWHRVNISTLVTSTSQTYDIALSHGRHCN